MVIYKNSIKNFIIDCEKNKSNIVAMIIAEMKQKLGYSVSEKEKESWKTTLVKTAKYFKELRYLEEQYIFLEFKIPKTRKRIDIILVGKNDISKNLLIIELKGWSKISNIKNSKFLKINTSYRKSLHPAYEGFDYLNILRNQFDEINDILF